jgi:hypothetical protein
MPQDPEPLIERVRDRIRGETSRGLRVTLRVAGGRPAERLDHRLVLEPNGIASLEVEDALAAHKSARRETLDPAIARELWDELEFRLDRFTRPSQAAFVPDALVGYAKFEVDAESIDLVFAPDGALLPDSRETTPSTPLGVLARHTILAAQRPSLEEEEEEE